MAFETYSVVDQFCDSPTNLVPKVLVRGVCFACGLPVCQKCSTRRTYHHYGCVRLCNGCQEDYDGSDVRVMRRLHTMAGVPYEVKADGTS